MSGLLRLRAGCPRYNLAAVTVHFGNPEPTVRLLERLSSYDIISSIVVVIHDDAHFFPGERIHYLHQENRGYAAGLNRAVRYVIEALPGTGMVLALNPDVRIEESQIVDLLHEHVSSGADCTFPVLLEGNHLIHGYRFTALGTMQRVQSRAEFFSGACFLFSVESWQRVEGFSEEYFHYFEDADFCLRLQRAGCRIHHAPEVVVQHQGKSGADYPATSLPKYAVRNHLLFLQKLGKLSMLSFCNVTVRHFLYLFRWKSGWRGIREWFRGVREFLNNR